MESLKNLRISVALGTAKQRLAALEVDADIYIINRENTQWLVEYYGHNWPLMWWYLMKAPVLRTTRQNALRH